LTFTLSPRLLVDQLGDTGEDIDLEILGSVVGSGALDLVDDLEAEGADGTLDRGGLGQGAEGGDGGEGGDEGGFVHVRESFKVSFRVVHCVRAPIRTPCAKL
jgi:hypothetical protein